MHTAQLHTHRHTNTAHSKIELFSSCFVPPSSVVVVVIIATSFHCGVFPFNYFFETLLIYCTGKFARHEINENIGVKYFQSERKFFLSSFLSFYNVMHFIMDLLRFLALFLLFSRAVSFYNDVLQQHLLLSDTMPGSGREFHRAIVIFIPLSLHSKQRLHPFDGKYFMPFWKVGISKGALYEMKNLLNWFFPTPWKLHYIRSNKSFTLLIFKLYTEHNIIAHTTLSFSFCVMCTHLPSETIELLNY